MYYNCILHSFVMTNIHFFLSCKLSFDIYLYAIPFKSTYQPRTNVKYFQELRERDGLMPVDAPAQRRRRNTIVPGGGRRGSVSVLDGQMRAELSTLHKKYDRLEGKEKRIQVGFPAQITQWYSVSLVLLFLKKIHFEKNAYVLDLCCTKLLIRQFICTTLFDIILMLMRSSVMLSILF